MERVEEPARYHTSTFPTQLPPRVCQARHPQYGPANLPPATMIPQKVCWGCLTWCFLMDINYEKLLLRCIYLCFSVLVLRGCSLMPPSSFICFFLDSHPSGSETPPSLRPLGPPNPKSEESRATRSCNCDTLKRFHLEDFLISLQFPLHFWVEQLWR